jgi:hypothetical protein|tara:strand:+ start:113 stop:625 length:513 start_codon:yes stop_codon:yes gene_type:complete
MIDKVILYAKTLQPLLKWIKDNPDDKEIKYTVTRLIRFYSNTPKELGLPYMYSIAALQEAIKLDIDNPEEKLKWVTWREQTNKSGLKDIGRKNGIFHLEHIVPISQIAKKLYELDNLDLVLPIYKILIDNFKIAWILKSEQKILDSINRSGIRTPELLTNLDIHIKGFNN